MPSPRMTRIVRALGIGIGVISVIALAYGIAFWHAGHAFPGDTLTYYLAGTRLNEGHNLYDLAADDVWLYAHPEFPLFGPPLIAVVWRPLAAIPNGWGIIIWLVAMNYCALTAIFWTLLGTRGWSGVLVLILVPSLTLLMGVGNVDAAILLGIIVVWTLVAAERPKAAGILVGVLASLKLTPAIFLIWFIARRQWTAVGWTVATGLVLAVVAVLGTGPGIWVRYARVIVEGSAAGRPGALIILAAGIAALFVVRSPRTSFALATVLMPLGSPVAAGHSWSLELAATAPFLRPLRRLRAPAADSGSATPVDDATPRG